MKPTLSLLVLPFLLTSSAGTAQVGEDVGIFVVGRTVEALEKSEKKAREKELKSERSRIEKSGKGLRKQIEKQHGKKSEEWPDAVRAQYEESLRADLLATLEYHEVTTEQKETRDSAEDINESLASLIEDGRAPRARLAAAADDAQLAVEVMTRRKKSGFPAFWQFVYLKVRPIDWEVPEDLARTAFDRMEREGELGVGLLASSSVGRTVKTIRPYGEAGPYWIIEVGLQGRNWSELGDFAAEVVAGLVAPPSATEGSPF